MRPEEYIMMIYIFTKIKDTYEWRSGNLIVLMWINVNEDGT